MGAQKTTTVNSDRRTCGKTLVCQLKVDRGTLRTLSENDSGSFERQPFAKKQRTYFVRAFDVHRDLSSFPSVALVTRKPPQENRSVGAAILNHENPQAARVGSSHAVAEPQAVVRLDNVRTFQARRAARRRWERRVLERVRQRKSWGQFNRTITSGCYKFNQLRVVHTSKFSPWQVLFACVDGEMHQVFHWQVSFLNSWHASCRWTRKLVKVNLNFFPSTRENKIAQEKLINVITCSCGWRFILHVKTYFNATPWPYTVDRMH